MSSRTRLSTIHLFQLGRYLYSTHLLLLLSPVSHRQIVSERVREREYVCETGRDRKKKRERLCVCECVCVKEIDMLESVSHPRV